MVIDFFHKYNTDSDFKNDYFDDNFYFEPWVSYTVGNEETHYNRYKTEQYLTFEVISSGNIQWKATDESLTKTIEYSKNGGEWTEITSTTAGTNISVVAGDVVKFRGNNYTYGDPDGDYPYSGCSGFRGTAGFNVYGNIMSLIDSENFRELDFFPSSDSADSKFVFSHLFEWCNTMVDATNLALPVTSLTEGAYFAMFKDCRGLINAPELPATNLGERCYQNMFFNCYALQNAPKLPARTILVSCYEGMFESCSALTKMATIKGTNTADWCYKRMYAGCSRLTGTTQLPASAVCIGSYYEMFIDCRGLINAPNLPATFVNAVGYYQMFKNCSSLTGAPSISCTTLGPDGDGDTHFCGMFQNCTSLVQAPELYITGVTKNCCKYMFENCTNLKYAMSKLLPETLDGNGCYQYMFQNCRNLETTPEIMATVLAQSVVVEYMFNGDSKVNHIKTHFIPNGTNSCRAWVKGVAATGTFECPSPGTTERGDNYIPAGWTMITF